MFYVNINDIDILQDTRHYIACELRTAVGADSLITPSLSFSLSPSLSPLSISPGTSERILQSKTELYDVFVDHQRLMTHLASLDPLLRLTPADKERYDFLNSIR